LYYFFIELQEHETFLIDDILVYSNLSQLTTPYLPIYMDHKINLGKKNVFRVKRVWLTKLQAMFTLLPDEQLKGLGLVVILSA